jgi:glycosyltransferase involved in cell wall biosynthesis
MHDPHSPPRVSVVLPVFNAARYVAEALDSILGQTLRDCECIVIDDGSTDGTPTILAGRAALDPRIRIVSRPNRGLTRTLNEGIGLARAAFVAIMNADDIASPGRLEKQVAFLDAHPRVAAVGSATITFAEAGPRKVVAEPPADPTALRSLLMRTSPFAHPTVMFRKQAVVDAGMYRPQFEPAEDYDLWLRLAERHDLANLTEPLLEYRVHAGQATARAFERVAVAMLAAQAAARLRQAGHRDPTPDLDTIDRDAAARLGVTDAAIARAAILAALGRAEMLLAVGASAETVHEILGGVAAGRVGRDAPRLLAAARLWIYARMLLADGRRAAAISGFIRAALADGAFRARLAGAVGRRLTGGTYSRFQSRNQATNA